MGTARDLIYGSLRLLDVIAEGETPSAQAQTDAFNILGDMLDDWSNQSLLRFPPIVENFNYVPGQQSYQMGTNGTPDFSTPRPQAIEQALTQIVGTNPANQIPIEIVNQQQWADIVVKTVQSSLPLKLWIQDTFPNMTLNFWPVPNIANQVVLFSHKPFTAIANVTSTISFPPGWAKALRYNLAIELAPEYGRSPSETVVAMAIESKAGIKRQNTKPLLMKTDVFRSGPGAFNWITGE